MGGGPAVKFLLLQTEGVTPVLKSSPFANIRFGVCRTAAQKWLAARDSGLAALMARNGLWLPGPEDVGSAFAALVKAVVFQQLAGAAAGAIYRRLLERLGVAHGDLLPEHLRGVDADLMPAAGLSGTKAATIARLTKGFTNGTLSEDFLLTAPWPTVEARLLSIGGIGPWTAQMFAIFHRLEPDILPATDLGIRKAVGVLQGRSRLASSAEVERVGRVWRPFRTVATWHLWRSLGGIPWRHNK